MKIKEKTKYIVIIILLIVALAISNFIYAAGSFSVSTSSSSLKPGGTATITIKTVNCAGKFNITSSNSGVVTVSTASTWVDGTTTIKATAKANGTATITVTPIDVSDTDLNDVKGSKSVTIKVTTPSNTTTSKPTSPSKPSTSTKPSGSGSTSSNKPSTNTTSNTLSNNALLKEFRVDQPGMTPAFSSTTYDYAITVGEDVSKINVTAVPQHSKAVAVVTGNDNLKEGDNLVTIRVTAQDKKTVKTYKITVTKTDDPVKSNAYLQNLLITNATLTPAFSSEELEYNCGTITSDIERLDISAFPVNEKAKVDIVGNDKLVLGENTIKIIVTSENGKFQKTYTLKVNKSEVNNLVNIYKDEKTFNKNLGNGGTLWNAIKENAGILLLYALVWIEFIQVVYLYERVRKLENRSLDLNKKITIKKDGKSDSSKK